VSVWLWSKIQEMLFAKIRNLETKRLRIMTAKERLMNEVAQGAIPVRIQRSRQHKQVSSNGLPIIYVGRKTKWGNPFVVGKFIHDTWWDSFDKEDKIKYFSDDYSAVPDNAEAVRLFKKYWKVSEQGYEPKELLKGKNLSCWCKVGEPCHADILLEMASSN
jgi:hypothetical protein